MLIAENAHFCSILIPLFHYYVIQRGVKAIGVALSFTVYNLTYKHIYVFKGGAKHVIAGACMIIFVLFDVWLFILTVCCMGLSIARAWLS